MAQRKPVIAELADRAYALAARTKDPGAAALAHELGAFARSFEHGITVLRRGAEAPLAKQQREQIEAASRWLTTATHEEVLG